MWFNYSLVEALANVVLFVPLGFVSSLAFLSKHVRQVASFGMLVYGCIELGQLLFIHERIASLSDIVMNTSGALLGAIVAAGICKWEASRLMATGLPKA